MSSTGDGANVREAAGERIPTVDVSNYEILAALREPGCALCSVRGTAERRMVQAFLREGRYSPGAREAFMRAGGFCPRHAWHLHRFATDEGTGAGIADVYKQLTARDIAWLDETAAKLKTRRGRRRLRRHFRRQGRCLICSALARSAVSHAYFLGQLLGDQRARQAFAGGDGLCSWHLEVAVRETLRADKGGSVSSFLADDWRRRIESLNQLLHEYDRKRDFRHAHEGRGEEQGSWTEVIRRYADSSGEGAPCTDHRGSLRSTVAQPPSRNSS